MESLLLLKILVSILGIIIMCLVFIIGVVLFYLKCVDEEFTARYKMLQKMYDDLRNQQRKLNGREPK